MSPADLPEGSEEPTGSPWIWAALLFAFPAALLWIRPPAPQPASAAAEVFSAERAWQHLERIAAEPHPAGSLAQARVQAYLSRELDQLGLEVELQTFEPPWEGWESPTPLTNVIARRRGSAHGTPEQAALLVDLHYDSVEVAPGAGDNGAAVAGGLEALRAWMQEPTGSQDVIFLFSDGEEAGLLGAWAFPQHPWFERVGMVLNFDARGAAGPSMLFQTGLQSAGLVRAYAEHAPHPSGTSLAPGVYERMPNDTDFTIFLERGLPGLNFAFLGGGQAYHTPRDSIASLDPGSLQHHGEALLALLRALTDQPWGPMLEAPAVEFFPLPFLGLAVIERTWMQVFTGGLALLALLCLGKRRAAGQAGAGLVRLVSWVSGCVLGAYLVTFCCQKVGHLAARSYPAPEQLGSSFHAGEVGGVGIWWTLLGLALLGARFVPLANARWGSLLAGLIACLALPFAVPGTYHVWSLPLLGALLALAPNAPVRRGLAWLPAGLIWLPLAGLLGQVGSITPTGESLLTSIGLGWWLIACAGPVRESAPRQSGTWAIALILAGAATLVLRAFLDGRGI